jgi:RNA polymerase sigma-70 factor, ECF subfamily
MGYFVAERWRPNVSGPGQWGSSAADVARDDRDADAVAVAAAQRNPAAFAPLYRAYFDPVYRYCHRSLGNPDAAADATQEVFARALASIRTTRVHDFRPWLFSIAHNVITDHHRRRGRRPNPSPLVAIAERPDPAPGPEAEAIQEDERSTVHAFLAQLPADQRAVVELRLADLSGAEVAEILGKSVGSVRVAQFRAFRRLRDLMVAADAIGDRDDRR